MNLNQANRTSYDALREEVLSLTEEECAELLVVLGITNPAHS